ncbi:hypothetical protein GCM10010520_52640 [Rhizobium viscosum]
MGGLFLDPFAQARLQRAMAHFEGTGRKCIATLDRHDTRFIARHRDENRDQFRMCKAYRHQSLRICS